MFNETGHTSVNRVDRIQQMVQAARRRKSLTELPSLLRTSVRLFWSASPAKAWSAVAVEAVNSLSIFAQVLLVKWVLDSVLAVGRHQGSVGRAVVPVLLLALLGASTSVVATVSDQQQRILGEMVARVVWRRVLDVSQDVDLSAYEEPSFYDQAQRVQESAVNQTRNVVQALVASLGGILGVLAGAIAVLLLAPPLLPLLLLSGVPVFLARRRSGRLEFDFAVQQSPRLRERRYLQQVLTRREEAKEVRAFALPEALRQRWESHYATYLADLKRHISRKQRLSMLGNLIGAGLLALTLLATLALVQSGRLSISAAAAALVAVRLLGGRVNTAAVGISTIYESSLFLLDLAEFLARTPAASIGPKLQSAPQNFETLTVEDLHFTYPLARRSSLSGVNLQVRRGEIVALVGENGSGKTTLAKLLANLHLPDQGAVRWDGTDLRTFDPESVRRRIAVIFQDFVRYKLSARDNIGLGRPDDDADLDAVRSAARFANADDFLNALPLGYNTALTKEYAGGVDLSLGQWQRVALARAFVRDAPFVVLDEPSASLDARAEHELFERIRSLFTGKTVLLISHRFSTVRSADRIYVLSKGEIIEQGDHASLMKADGLYAELFCLQANAYLSDPECQGQS